MQLLGLFRKNHFLNMFKISTPCFLQFQPEFLLTCLQIIFENAVSCPSSNSNEFLRLNVVQMKPGRTMDPLISALEEVLQLPNNNIRVRKFYLF